MHWGISQSTHLHAHANHSDLYGHNLHKETISFLSDQKNKNKNIADLFITKDNFLSKQKTISRSDK